MAGCDGGMDWGHRAPFLKSRAEVVGIRMSKEAESQLSSDFKRSRVPRASGRQ